MSNILMLMSEPEKIKLHEAVLEILAKIGISVEHKAILKKLSEFGAEVNMEKQLAKFPKNLIQKYLDNAVKYDWDNAEAYVDAEPGIFMGSYLNPETGKYENWSEKIIKNYVKLAKHLPNIGRVEMICCPVSSVPGEIHTLYSKYLNWKYDMTINSSILDTALCPFIEEFFSIRAASVGGKIKDLMHGYVFMISPLRFPRTEAEQFVFCAEKGYGCGIGKMISIGGSGPVTIAGTVAVHLAENIFTCVLQHIYYGKKNLAFGCSISPLDMKRASFCYGRPEKTIANIIYGQMAVYFGASFLGGAGQADAKNPGSEAASQKLLTALPQLMHFKNTQIRPGLLSVDEVNSPIQLILDNEVVGALKRIIKPVVIDEDTLALDTIVEAGHGGLFTDKMHTAEHFREELWETKLWSGDLFSGWAEKDGKHAEDKALNIYGK